MDRAVLADSAPAALPMTPRPPSSRCTGSGRSRYWCSHGGKSIGVAGIDTSQGHSPPLSQKQKSQGDSRKKDAVVPTSPSSEIAEGMHPVWAENRCEGIHVDSELTKFASAEAVHTVREAQKEHVLVIISEEGSHVAPESSFLAISDTTHFMSEAPVEQVLSSECRERFHGPALRWHREQQRLMTRVVDWSCLGIGC